MAKRWVVALLSLIPWAAFLVAATVADHAESLVGLVLAGPVYLGFVALPAAFPIAVARHRVTRIAATAVTTATATAAGVLVATSEDAQAGLAVLLVPYVAIPLGTALVLGQHLVGRILSPNSRRASTGESG